MDETTTTTKANPLATTRLGVRLFFDGGRMPPADDLMVTFGRWVTGRMLTGVRLIDTVSYKHAQHGRWVMLIGTSATWIVDAKGGEAGLRYMTRHPRPLAPSPSRHRKDGSRAHLRASYAAVLTVARYLRADLGVTFRTDVLEVEVADRRVAPNTPETYTRAEETLRAFAREVFDEPRLLPASAGDPDSFFRVRIEGTRKRSLDSLIARLDELEARERGR